jgi:hypothetical protein
MKMLPRADEARGSFLFVSNCRNHLSSLTRKLIGLPNQPNEKKERT